VRLVFAGTPAAAVPSLTRLRESAHELAAVLTRPAAPAGRGRTPRRSPVADRAAEFGLPLLTPRRPGDPDFVDELTRIAPDLVVVVGYGALIPGPLLDQPPHGWVNLHFSLLPAWRGAAPVQHALLAGDDLTGACTFRLEATLDTGPVYGVVTEPIRPRDTAGALLDRLAVSGAELLLQTVDGIAAGRLAPRPQPADGVSYAPKLTVDDVRIDWAAPAVRVDRLARAATPTPGAWTTFRGRRLKLGPVQPAAGGPLAPGQLAVDAAGVRVGTGSHPVVLGEVQPDSRPAMPATDWARGARPQPGEILG
jgi:methionyl-tRNA formyltransferase